MDWARARGILIATFTVVNILLAYLVLGGGAALSLGALPDRWPVRELRERLRQEGIVLAAPLPRHQPVPPFLRVTAPDGAGVERLAAALIKAAELNRLQSEIKVANDGTVWLSVLPAAGQTVDRGADRLARQAADRFLRQSKLQSQLDLRWSRTYMETPQRFAVEYMLYVKGRRLFPGMVKIGVGDTGIVDVEAYIPNVEGFRGESRGVLAASEALLRLAGHLQWALEGRREVPATVTVVELGYYAPSTPGARWWDTVPTWRFVLASGEVYYINAFTGDLEQS